MSYGMNHDRLSWGDALFLYLEREGMPLNIASVSVFEGRIPLVTCRKFIESKLPKVPRYRQRIVAPPLNLAFPTWENDPEFDIRNHVRQVRLKCGTEAEFKEVAGKTLSTTLDREHPLWDFILIQGLRGDRTGVVARVHHCLADGIAGVGLMNVIMDQGPQVSELPRKQGHFSTAHRPDPWAEMVDLGISSYSNVVERILGAQAEVLDLAERIVADEEEWPIQQLIRLLPELARPTERLFFNISYRGPQKFAWVQIPMEEIQAVREACGATHNDVVLTLVTAAVRRYAQLHGDVVRKRLLRIMVPVNVRGDEHVSKLGNRVSLLPVTIPLDLRNPRRLLSAVRERMEFLKLAHVAELVNVAGGLMGAFPTSLQALAGPVASQLPITPFNLVCTNVPGPRSPLYLLGQKMLHWYPYVPVGGDMAVNCAVLSYNGNSYFGLSGDVHAAPDLGRLATFLRLSFEELKLAAGVKRSRDRARQPVSAPSRPTLLRGKPFPASACTSSARAPAKEMKHDQLAAGMAAD